MPSITQYRYYKFPSPGVIDCYIFTGSPNLEKTHHVVMNDFDIDSISLPDGIPPTKQIKNPVIGMKIWSKFTNQQGISFWLDGVVESIPKGKTYKTVSVLYSDNKICKRTKISELFEY